MTKAVEKTPSPPPAKMTYEEFLEWADEDTHAEWVNGEVIWMPPISNEHNDESGFILHLVLEFVAIHDLGVVRYEPFQMKTGPNLPGRSPDILFVAKENLSRLQKTYLNGPADLVVEIVSPESRARDRCDKYREYEQGGVREYWLIDNLRKQAEFYQRGEDGSFHLAPVGADAECLEASVGADGIYRSAALDGFWLKVEWLWQDPKPPLLSVLKEWGLI